MCTVLGQLVLSDTVHTVVIGCVGVHQRPRFWIHNRFWSRRINLTQDGCEQQCTRNCKCNSHWRMLAAQLLSWSSARVWVCSGKNWILSRAWCSAGFKGVGVRRRRFIDLITLLWFDHMHMNSWLCPGVFTSKKWVELLLLRMHSTLDDGKQHQLMVIYSDHI